MGDRLCANQLATDSGKLVGAFTTDDRHITLCRSPHTNKREVPIQVWRLEICPHQSHKANDGDYDNTMRKSACSHKTVAIQMECSLQSTKHEYARQGNFLGCSPM